MPTGYSVVKTDATKCILIENENETLQHRRTPSSESYVAFNGEAIAPHSMRPPMTQMWYAARTRHNQERFVKSRLEQIGVEHFVPFRTELRRRRDRAVELLVPVIPNLVFIHTDYPTSIAIANNYGVRISYIKCLDGAGHLVVPQKQMDDFRLLCESNVSYALTGELTRGDRVAVIDGSLAGLEGELVHSGRNGGRVVVKLDSIASFELTISVDNLRKIR